MIALLLSLLLSAAVVRPLPVTPGVVRPLTRAQVCGTTWGKDRRHVTLTMRKHVFAAYGIPYAQHALYEVDHLIPRELGGADDEANLWPQPWDGPHGAHAKDRLENDLKRRVCRGEMALELAQEAIRSDWIAAYQLYVAPNTPAHHKPDQTRRDIKAPSQRSERRTIGVLATDDYDVSFGKFRGRPRFATTQLVWMQGRAASAFLRHVDRVVLRRPDEQVIRPNARGRVATMADIHAGRDRSVVNRPRESVRAALHPVRHSERAVAAHLCPGPQPTSVALADALPEAHDGIDLEARRATGGRATAASTTEFDL